MLLLQLPTPSLDRVLGASLGFLYCYQGRWDVTLLCWIAFSLPRRWFLNRLLRDWFLLRTNHFGLLHWARGDMELAVLAALTLNMPPFGAMVDFYTLPLFQSKLWFDFREALVFCASTFWTLIVHDDPQAYACIILVAMGRLPWWTMLFYKWFQVVMPVFLFIFAYENLRLFNPATWIGGFLFLILLLKQELGPGLAPYLISRQCEHVPPSPEFALGIMTLVAALTLL